MFHFGLTETERERGREREKEKKVEQATFLSSQHWLCERFIIYSQNSWLGKNWARCKLAYLSEHVYGKYAFKHGLKSLKTTVTKCKPNNKFKPLWFLSVDTIITLSVEQTEHLLTKINTNDRNVSQLPWHRQPFYYKEHQTNVSFRIFFSPWKTKPPCLIKSERSNQIKVSHSNRHSE